MTHLPPPYMNGGKLQVMVPVDGLISDPRQWKASGEGRLLNFLAKYHLANMTTLTLVNDSLSTGGDGSIRWLEYEVTIMPPYKVLP